jgi:hypothetical protein
MNDVYPLSILRFSLTKNAFQLSLESIFYARIFSKNNKKKVIIKVKVALAFQN